MPPVILSFYILLLSFSGHLFGSEVELHEYLEKTGEPLPNCGMQLPKSLEIGSQVSLNGAHLEYLLTAYRHAGVMAGEFAVLRNLTLSRNTLPSRLVLLKDTQQVALFTKQPEFDRLGRVIARINLQQGIVYLSRLNSSDLYMELGKWFFYKLDYIWGRDLKEDREHLDLITGFSKFCIEHQEFSAMHSVPDFMEWTMQFEHYPKRRPIPMANWSIVSSNRQKTEGY